MLRSIGPVNASRTEWTPEWVERLICETAALEGHFSEEISHKNRLKSFVEL